MSGTQVSSSVPLNILYDSISGKTGIDLQSGQNQLLQQQQDIGGHEIEMGARLAGTLLSQYQTPEARAAAYPTLLANARASAPGYFKNAPASYPGDDQARALAGMGISAKDQYSMGFITPPGLAENLRTVFGQNAPTSTAPAAGGGTNAPPGTSTPTAPQNLAGIHPDLTQFRLPSGAGATVAKSAAPQFQGLLTDLEAAGYKLDPDTTGGYNPRNIAGTNTPSQHAYGLAMDVNWQRNPRGANTQADIPPDLARSLAAKWGLTWGGDWQGADRDPMHFEVARGSGPGTDHPKGVATGWNANNPLNLTTDTGGVVTPGGARLANFGSMADGVAATAAKLQSYQTDRGLNTVRQMYTEWHKGSAVNDADMQRIAGAMGVGVDQPFQLDPTKTAAWITAAQPGETGGAGKRLSQADIAAGVRQASAATPVAPGGVAARTGGTDTAGPGAGSETAAAPVQQQPPTAPVVQPGAQPGTGVNSPQYHQAQQMLRQAAAIEMGPGGQLPQAKAAVAYLKSQAALVMQADSVSVDPNTGIQTKQLTGERLNAANPNAHYVWNDQHNAWIDETGTHPPVTPRAPSLTTTKEGTILQSEPGGKATVVYTTDPKRVAEQAAAAAQGTATGTATAQALPKIIDQGRAAATAEGNIDYGLSQLDKARAGGINTGYFSGALTEVQSALKSLGVPTDKVPFINVDPTAIGNIQTARKTLSVVSGAILQQILGPGSSITDAKIDAFIHAQPGIETDPDAVRRVLAWARSQFTYEREMAQAAVKDAAQPGSGGMLPPGWQAGYYDRHGLAPIYNPETGEMRQPDGSAPGRESPETVTLPAAARSSLKEGHETTFGNGQVWTLRNGQPIKVR